MFFKKNFKLAALAVGGLLACSMFAGCGEQSGGGNAAAGDEIVVGSNFELTGNHAQYGANTAKGFSLAVKEVNDAGGINGKKIKIVEADSKSDSAESVNAATKLISDDKVITIVGPAVTANVIAESQVATENKIPVIGPAATNPTVTVDGELKPYIFRSCFIDPQQGDTMAQFAAKDLKAKTAVLYLDSSSDYSKSLGKVFKETFEKEGGQVVMEEAFLAKDQDFKAALTKIKTANADVIFVPAYYEEVGKIVKQARELGITAAILGSDGWDDSKVADIAGADALNNTFFCTHYFEGDEDVQGFISAYKKEYNEDPNVFAALGYDAGKMLIDAIQRGGDSSEKIRENLETIKDLKVGTGVITMNKETHNPIKGIVVLENKNGVRELRTKIAPEG